MQHVDPLIGLVSVVLWLAYVYSQHLNLGWLFAIVSKLRRARKARGWTIEEAAEKVGVDWTTYSRWERGQQEPHPRNVETLERVFSTKAEELGFKEIVSKTLYGEEGVLIQEYFAEVLASAVLASAEEALRQMNRKTRSAR